MRYLIVAIFAFLLVVASGCVVKTYRAYSGDDRDASETALVMSVDDERFRVGFSSYAELAGGEMSDFKTVGNTWAGYPKKMAMLPGTYLVMTHCATGAYYSFPSFTLQARAGKTYEVSCQYVKGELGKIQAIAREVVGSTGESTQ